MPENTKSFPVPRGDLVGRGSMLSIGGSKKNDSGGGTSYTSGGYLPVDTRYSRLTFKTAKLQIVIPNPNPPNKQSVRRETQKTESDGEI